MRKGPGIRDGALLALWSLGLAVWAGLLLQSGRFTILNHEFRLLPLELIPAWVLFFLILAGVWKALGAAANGELPDRARDRLLFFPLAFFFLSPWLLSHYLTRQDLRTRLVLLAVFIAAAVLTLGSIRKPRAVPKPPFLDNAEARWEKLSRRRKLLILFAAAFLVYNVCCLILVSQGITFSGDEPHYLMTSHSLLRDQDLNVANNYDRKDYFHFYDESRNPNLRLTPHGRHGRLGWQYVYPINLPGISVLILPFYGLSFLAKGGLVVFLLKGSLSLWAALLGVQFYLLALQLWSRERLALRLWLLYAFTAPVLFYSFHLYPELPVAFFSIMVYRKITSAGALSPKAYLLIGFLLGLLPWFGLKYNTLFWPLLAIAALYVLKIRRDGARSLLFLLAFPLLSQALFYFFTYQLYGTLSPFSIYKGVITPDRVDEIRQGYLDIPFRQRVESFFEYFLDQRDGLLLYSPLYFFSALGLVEIFRARRRDFWVLLFLTLPYLAVHAIFTERGGFSPQGRPLASISWVMMILVGYFLARNKHPLFGAAFKAAAAISLAAVALLLFHPSFLYQPTSHDIATRPGDLFVFLSGFGFFLPPLLPSFIKIPNQGYLPNTIWLAGIAVFILAYALARPARPGKLSRALSSALVFASLAGAVGLWVLYPRPALYPVKTISYAPQKVLAFYPFPMGKGAMIKPPGDLYLHLEKDYKILFSAKTRFDRLTLEFGSESGDYEIMIRWFDRPVFEGRVDRAIRSIDMATPAFYPLRNLCLHEFDVRVKKLSGENMLRNPVLFRIIPPAR